MKIKKYLSLLVTLVLCFTVPAGTWSAAAEEAAAGMTAESGMHKAQRIKSKYRRTGMNIGTFSLKTRIHLK